MWSRGRTVTQGDTTYTPRGAAPSRVEALSLLTSHTGLATEEDVHLVGEERLTGGGGGGKVQKLRIDKGPH